MILSSPSANPSSLTSFRWRNFAWFLSLLQQLAILLGSALKLEGSICRNVDSCQNLDISHCQQKGIIVLVLEVTKARAFSAFQLNILQRLHTLERKPAEGTSEAKRLQLKGLNSERFQAGTINNCQILQPRGSLEPQRPQPLALSDGCLKGHSTSKLETKSPTAQNIPSFDPFKVNVFPQKSLHRGDRAAVFTAESRGIRDRISLRMSSGKLLMKSSFASSSER
nr:hypothetical protein Iba_chr11aCG15930 [Ipomoea batatas]